MAKSMLDAIPAAEKDTPVGRRAIKVTSMMFEEPNIVLSALEAVTAPTLVLASDHDLIKDEHTLDIYHHLPNSQLVIFPNATHMPCWVHTSARRFLAMGTGAVIRLYVRNFWSEILYHSPKDTSHVDVRS